MESVWKRRSVWVFFLVGFGVPWLGWGLRGALGINQPPWSTLLFYTGDFMTVGGFVATYVAAGRPGVLHLLRRYLQLPAPIGWVLFAFFLPLIWTGASSLIYGLRHGGIGRFEPAGLLAYFSGGAFLAWTTGPLGEEAGWRGYLLPRLLSRYTPLGASLLLGLIWSIWHYPLYYRSVFASFEGAAQFTVACLCYSVLLTVLWAHTRGSVLWAIVLHWAMNVTPGVVAALFPDIRPPERAADWLRVICLIVVTVIVVGGVGVQRLRERLAGVLESLREESIERDRVAA